MTTSLPNTEDGYEQRALSATDDYWQIGLMMDLHHATPTTYPPLWEVH